MILNKIYKLLFLLRYRFLMKRLSEGGIHQEKILRYLLIRNKHTEMGVRHEFAHIKSYKDFSSKLPIRGYDEIQEEIKQCIEGKQNIFWCEKIDAFGKSSGTTDRSKFIPLTREALLENHYLGGKDMITLYLKQYPSSRIFQGKNLVLNGSFDQENNPSIGDISAHIVRNLPWWIRYYRIPHLTYALEKDWNIKLEKLAEETVRSKVVVMTGVPSWMMVVLQKVNQGSKDKAEVWKDLEVFFHGGIHFYPLKAKFEELLGKQINYFQLYNATEGFFAIQEKLGEEDMLLLTNHGIFYEFAPIEQQLPVYEKTVAISGIEIGKRYEMIITTNAGLWRYALGDVIEITQCNPAKLKIIGRTKQYINLFGEELMVHNAELAIAQACLQMQCSIINYTVAPLLLEGGKGVHEWWIEFDQVPDSIQKFGDLLDQTIRSVNSDYDAKRTGDLMLQKPQIKILPHHTFYRWLEDNKKLGGQNKVTRLKNDRTMIEALVKYIDENGESIVESK